MLSIILRNPLSHAMSAAALAANATARHAAMDAVATGLPIVIRLLPYWTVVS